MLRGYIAVDVMDSLFITYSTFNSAEKRQFTNYRSSPFYAIFRPPDISMTEGLNFAVYVFYFTLCFILCILYCIDILCVGHA